uniref:(northern house mosquito) hypothetical protein n=1 Tax=Culex pipiens TaxID=7175 RepID=A0A8D8BI55_CULPI
MAANEPAPLCIPSSSSEASMWQTGQSTQLQINHCDTVKCHPEAPAVRIPSRTSWRSMRKLCWSGTPKTQSRSCPRCWAAGRKSSMIFSNSCSQNRRLNFTPCSSGRTAQSTNRTRTCFPIFSPNWSDTTPTARWISVKQWIRSSTCSTKRCSPY